MIPRPPQGYERVCDGPVLVGDHFWSPDAKEWIEVTPDVFRDLCFLDAAVVDELVSVCRPTPEKTP